LFDPSSSTFKVLDRSNVSFLIEPEQAKACPPNSSLLLLALSALANLGRRDALRRKVESHPDIGIVFLLGEAGDKKDQLGVVEEAAVNGDILQVSDPESYKRLSYKTLSGLLWTSLRCGQIKFVGKTDDDVQLDLPNLLGQLEKKHGEETEFLSCPSPSRNYKPTRTTREGSIGAKWSPTWEALPRRTWPDFCFGWLWISTPRVGLALAEVGASHGEEMLQMARWDDSFVTGFLRERLDLSITCLTPGPRGVLWDLLLSYCPLFSIVKQHLFNDFVLRKGPANMPYVNNYKFFLCNTLEFHLERLETAFSFISPLLTPFWSVCARK